MPKVIVQRKGEYIRIIVENNLAKEYEVNGIPVIVEEVFTERILSRYKMYKMSKEASVLKRFWSTVEDKVVFHTRKWFLPAKVRIYFDELTDVYAEFYDGFFLFRRKYRKN